jgi:hypothetical protein
MNTVMGLNKGKQLLAQRAHPPCPSPMVFEIKSALQRHSATVTGTLYINQRSRLAPFMSQMVET